MPDAFYLPSGPDRFRATELTRGPWEPGLQHAGPPAALLGRAVERHSDHPGFQVARGTLEILRPRPTAGGGGAPGLRGGGRGVELVEASLRAGDAEVMRATALRIRTAEVGLPDVLAPGPPLPGPDAGPRRPF